MQTPCPARLFNSTAAEQTDNSHLRMGSESWAGLTKKKEGLQVCDHGAPTPHIGAFGGVLQGDDSTAYTQSWLYRKLK